MNSSAVKVLHYMSYLHILSKLHQPIGGFNLKEFLNTTSRVNTYDYIRIQTLTQSCERASINLHCSAN